MFATRSHPGEEPSGPGLLERIRAAGVNVPLIAIGGITPENVAEVMYAGANGAAVITNVLASDDPEAAARRLKSAMMDAIPESSVNRNESGADDRLAMERR